MSLATENSESDILWGAGAIAAFIQRPRRATFHLLEKGALPAKKIGSRWCASKARLLAHLLDEA